MSFLGLTGKTYLVLGVANKKSVAWHVAKTLEVEGAKVVYSLRSQARLDSLKGLLDGKPVPALCAQRQALLGWQCRNGKRGERGCA